MITMNELVDLRMQQHIAHEIYRQQVMQRIPDPFPPLLPIPMPRHVIIPPRASLPGVEATLQNKELWKQFHQIGTEMIITKSGRRMFPSMRLALSGLEDDANYCVLLEMIPIGDCRYKFSGSQWVPAGGAEPQSPQRMFLHPDSPATGAHWQTQPILFNKVKLTNNTLDNNGHIVLASMHKYQPRLHIIRTSDLTQIPWAPQKAFVFSEMEFVAVTAYQNDRITKLKIDNNPFAKGFRETGQSRCKRKMSSSPPLQDDQRDQQQDQQQPQPTHANNVSPMSKYTATSLKASSTCRPSDDDKSVPEHYRHQHQNQHQHMLLNCAADDDDDGVGQQIKRHRSNDSACSTSSSFDDSMLVVGNSDFSSNNSTSSGTNSPHLRSAEAVTVAVAATEITTTTKSSPFSPPVNNHTKNYDSQPYINTAESITTSTASTPPSPAISSASTPTPTSSSTSTPTSAFIQHFQQNVQTLLRPSLMDLACSYFGRSHSMYPPPSLSLPPPPPPSLSLPPPPPSSLPPLPPPLLLPEHHLMFCNNNEQQFGDNLIQSIGVDVALGGVGELGVAMPDPAMLLHLSGAGLPPLSAIVAEAPKNINITNTIVDSSTSLLANKSYTSSRVSLHQQQQQQQELSSSKVSLNQNQTPPPQKKTKNFSISAILDGNS